MKYTEKEVVEILTEYVGGMLPLKQFLKKKGLIKEEFEVGKWYKSKNHNITACYVDEHNNYGVSFGVWKDAMILNHFEAWTLATDKEVETALIKGAKKLIKKGVVKCVWEDEGIYHRNMNGDLEYSIEGGYLKFGSYIIFDGGKWATIIEEPKEMTMAEVNKALGYEIKIKE